MYNFQTAPRIVYTAVADNLQMKFPSYCHIVNRSIENTICKIMYAGHFCLCYVYQFEYDETQLRKN